MSSNTPIILFLCISFLGLNACHSVPSETTVSAAKLIEKALPQVPARPPEPQPAPLSPPILPPQPMVLPNPLFDIHVNKVAAPLFFMSLVKGTQVNMIVHPEVTGDISLQLKQVHLEDILKVIQKTYGYNYYIDDIGIHISPARLHTEIIEVNYLNITRRGHSQMTVSAGQLSQAGGIQNQNNNEIQGISPQHTSQINTQHSDSTFWQELQHSIEIILADQPQRQVVVNPQSSTVLVRAMPSEISEVKQLIKKMHTITQRQVILEAKILEIQLNDKFQAGVNWAGLLRSDNGRRQLIGAQTGAHLNVDSLQAPSIDNFINSQGGFNTGAATQLTRSGFGGLFSAALRLGDFAAFIELLKTQGNVQVLSSPRIATLNNQKAVIKVGTDEYFVTDITTTTTVTNGTISNNPSIDLTPFFSGVSLDVTPHITQTGDILLHIHPSVSKVVDQQKTITLGNTVQNFPLALSSVRESDSIVRARTEQLIIIGGLMQYSGESHQAAPPVMGDIPVLGNVFKHQQQQQHKSELVILLRPIIVDTAEQWQDVIQQTQQRLQQMQQGANTETISISGEEKVIETTRVPASSP